ncbi:5'/3'-nucleotidase SurE [Amycolatopsis vancoresmycina]|uniref:5'-nucleotidase n=1 Tax=Amycolatopsis vancoresmycina DSM 44592 TaxID=1292037 RepID=R1HI21_9PSEU|nr:5'/3'-nucleotidase SurE [Amycolatopsis vancoresmycina]EOD58074.1 stationary phase survival protein SurE [Amycolatopsis vancoresmycina DSM 44592]
MLSKVLRVAIAAAVVTAVAVPAQASAREDGVSLAGKKVVLVNDDGVQAAKANGSDGRGIYVLRQALCQAGADVAVVGPWGQQSGKSRAVSGAPFVAVAPPLAVPAEFAADCANAPGHGLVLGACQATSPCAADSPSVTPADSVDIALTGVLPQRLGWTNGPDLVVSGINSGPNTDIAVNGSGTIGAATVAVERGVPAVAVSAGTQVSPPPSNDTYKAAADVVVRLLASPRTWTFVKDMALVNVNQPDVQPGAGPSPVRWTSVGRVVQGRIAYTPTGDGTYQVGYNAVTPPPVLEPGSDTKALLDGYVSVSAVDVNRTFTGSLTRHR